MNYPAQVWILYRTYSVHRTIKIKERRNEIQGKARIQPAPDASKKTVFPTVGHSANALKYSRVPKLVTFLSSYIDPLHSTLSSPVLVAVRWQKGQQDLVRLLPTTKQPTVKIGTVSETRNIHTRV
eukprot:2241257-Pyramimonas_sp.AAC.2